MNSEIRNCKFSFKCPKTWDLMVPTANPDVRSCDVYKQDVYLALTQWQLDRNIERGLCTAAPDLAGEIMAGAIAPEMHSQWASLYLIPEQLFTTLQVQSLAKITGLGAMQVKLLEGRGAPVLLYQGLPSQIDPILSDLESVGLRCSVERR